MGIMLDHQTLLTAILTAQPRVGLCQSCTFPDEQTLNIFLGTLVVSVAGVDIGIIGSLGSSARHW